MSGDQSRLGSYIGCSIAGEAYQAALPPQPPLNLLGLQGLLSKANQALGKLDAVADILPPDRLMDCLGAFETIHPFLDGNGRIGRLLITFFLMMMGDLRQPSLYLSLFFKNNREEYYRRFGAVCTAGDWR